MKLVAHQAVAKMHGVGYLSPRPLCGLDELWIGEAGKDENPAHLANRLIERCLTTGATRSGDNPIVGTLSVAERNRLLLELRQISYGDDVRTSTACPRCATQNELTFRFSELPFDFGVPEGAEVRLPDGGSAWLCPPTARDQQDLLSEPGLSDEQRRIALLARSLVRPDGREGPFSADEISGWPPELRSAMFAALDKVLPDLQCEMSLVCIQCRETITAVFHAGAFFFAEINQRSKRLLGEVHRIARVYHWAEQEILALPCPRRLAYLLLIEKEEDALMLRTAGKGRP